MPQVCTMCKILKDESEFNQIKRKSEVRLAKSCRECNLKKSEEKKEGLGVNISAAVDQGRWQQNYRSVGDC